MIGMLGVTGVSGVIGEGWQAVAWTAVATGVAVAAAVGARTGEAAAGAGLWRVLGSPGPHPGVARRSTLYDRLLGDWEVEVLDFDSSAPPRASRGEWHFGWVLEGRAIQDVFIVPALGERGGPVGPGNRYGTSIRVYDPRSDEWLVRWINPVNGAFNTLIGRRQGDDIVQEGRNDAGARIRWSFSEITATSFRWRGEISHDDGATWSLQVEFHGRRSS